MNLVLLLNRIMTKVTLLYKTRTRAQCIFMSIFIMLNSNFGMFYREHMSGCWWPFAILMHVYIHLVDIA